MVAGADGAIRTRRADAVPRARERGHDAVGMRQPCTAFQAVLLARCDGGVAVRAVVGVGGYRSHGSPSGASRLNSSPCAVCS